jgi:hypothetical protein
LISSDHYTLLSRLSQDEVSKLASQAQASVNGNDPNAGGIANAIFYKLLDERLASEDSSTGKEGSTDTETKLWEASQNLSLLRAGRGKEEAASRKSSGAEAWEQYGLFEPDGEFQAQSRTC